MASKKTEIKEPEQMGGYNTTGQGRPRAGPKKQLMVRVPMTMFDDLETLRAMSIMNGDGWTINGQINEWLEAYLDERRADIDEFKARIRTE